MGIPAFIFFLNFSIFELKLLYNLWRNQNNAEFINNPASIRSRLLKFYITFYVFLFMSIFFVTKFYFVKPYIIGAIAITWIPQIVHNFYNKNQASLPIIVIFTNTLNKVLIPLYFKGFKDNIFYLRTDINLVYLCCFIISIQVVILYMQTVCGSRFFFPFKINQSSEHRFYYSNDELIDYKKETEYVNICYIIIRLNVLYVLEVYSIQNHSARSVKKMILMLYLK